MAFPWNFSFYLASMLVVWDVLKSWISICISAASEIARALRTGDIGPFHVG
ncbi:hypothetical protein AMTRI_Chr01g105390 [Amborella trichopoda]